ncbi:MAG: FAD-binding protein [Gammaproteobacteria bacterium]|nr:FAD-binding protein [Gammaproteobacteria bacterium]
MRRIPPGTVMQINRISSSEFGNAIDRSKPLEFTFDDQKLTGFAGDTVASALLANNIHLVGRSIKFHRPRGILSSGIEEPSAIIECSTPGDGPVPNLKATEVLLSEGLVVKSQNNWPSRKFDAFGVLSYSSQLLTAGFYYKTFLWPNWGWHRIYEKVIRKFAGLGRVQTNGSGTFAATADKRHKYCQILIIGSGPAGLSAALTCSRKGIRVVLFEQEPNFGGSLLWRKGFVGEVSANQWISETVEELNQSPNVELFSHTMVFGHYDHGLTLAYQKGSIDDPDILWKIRADRILLASGSIERPLTFPNNDRPGIMLAGAIRKYINCYAVRPGIKAFVAIADEAERDAAVADCCAAGIEVVECLKPDQEIVNVHGRHRVKAVSIKGSNRKTVRYTCDLMCVSGGWIPAVHLAAHIQGKLSVDENSQVPTPPDQCGPLLSVGASRGIFDLNSILKDGQYQAHQAMSQIGVNEENTESQPAVIEPVSLPASIQPVSGHNAFVDLQNDVTYDDLTQTVAEGYHDIELVKRYTATGMGTDQGKTSWVNASQCIAAAIGESPKALGHTTFRPPYSPVPFSAIAGARIDDFMKPIRRTPLHKALKKLNCVFQTSGDWLYPRYFPQENETLEQAVNREVRAVRSSVGFVDMSTLGKFEIKGPDAEAFLSRLYCSNVAAIPVGKVRYGLMLREDGILFDDGTIARLGDHHYVVTATTANSEAVWRWMTRLAQTQWSELNVTLANVSEHWATIAIAGPRSRDVLSKFNFDFETSRREFPFASIREGVIDIDVPCRVYSVSYSGELSFEINIPAGYANSFIDRLFDIGQEFDLIPYGLETLDVLRIEKGHISVGREIDGRTTPYDLGLGKMVSVNKDFIGRSLLNRPSLKSTERMQLVGLTATNQRSSISPGGVLAAQPYSKGTRQDVIGHLTASIYSPTFDRWIALGLLRNGKHRHDDSIWVVSPIAGQSTEVKVCSTNFYDETGERLNG